MIESIWYSNGVGRWLLWPAAALFGALAAARRRLYAAGLRRTIRVGVPVVVIGNITVGGTGKTPLLIWLADGLARHGLRAGIVTRGYGGTASDWPRQVAPDSDAREVGDEPVLLARRSGCPVVAAPDRVAAARALVSARRVDVLLSDDGLQHYRLAREFEIAVVDGARGLGNGALLPAGPLREPRGRLDSVDAVVVNGGGFAWAGAYRAALDVREVIELATGTRVPLEHFAGQRVHAVAGIGHPARFFTMLERAGVAVTPHAWPDHARFERADLEFADGLPVLMTEKDAVKCAAVAPPGVFAVIVDMRVDDGERLVARIVTAISRRHEP